MNSEATDGGKEKLKEVAALSRPHGMVSRRAITSFNIDDFKTASIDHNIEPIARITESSLAHSTGILPKLPEKAVPEDLDQELDALAVDFSIDEVLGAENEKGHAVESKLGRELDLKTILTDTAARTKSHRSSRQSVHEQRLHGGAPIAIATILKQLSAEPQYAPTKVNELGDYIRKGRIESMVSTIFLISVVPSIFFISFMLIPLSDISLGIENNLGFVVQLFVIGFVSGMMYSSLLAQCLPKKAFGLFRFYAIPVVHATFFTSWVVLLSSIAGFPLFFTPLSGGIPSAIFIYCFILLIVKRKLYDRELSNGFRCIMLCLLIYSLYQGISVSYDYLAKSAYPATRLASIIALPAAKFVSKHSLAWAGKFISTDLGIVLSVFVCKTFNKIYVAVLLHAAKGEYAGSILLFGIEVIENAYMIFRMRKRLADMVHKLEGHHGLSNPSLMDIAKNSKDVSAYNLCLRLLHRIEVLVSSLFVKIIVPLMYAAYVYFVHQLPSHKYVNGMKDMNSDQFRSLLFTLLQHGVLGIISLLVMRLSIKQKIKHPVFRHLFFALERHRNLILVLITTWIFFALVVQQDHMGTDHTLYF